MTGQLLQLRQQRRRQLMMITAYMELGPGPRRTTFNRQLLQQLPTTVNFPPFSIALQRFNAILLHESLFSF